MTEAALLASAGIVCVLAGCFRRYRAATMAVYGDFCIWAAVAFAAMSSMRHVPSIIGFSAFAVYTGFVFTRQTDASAERSLMLYLGGILSASALAAMLLRQSMHIMILTAGIFILSLYLFNNSTATK